MARTTVKDLAARADKTDAALATIAEAVTTLVGQFATPGAVAEKVSVPTQATPVKSASDLAREYVTEQGLAFARGGRSTLNAEALQACVRVLKTGTPEIVRQSGLGTLDKRNIVGVAVFRTDDGKAVNTQYLYQPE